eukprot:INCI18118.3.p1 GENE.INCI18118.3~~INCI18118.3.p1  ORF type:complete len:950 (-),score=167.00 INCI18118.3:206-3055(-)
MGASYSAEIELLKDPEVHTVTAVGRNFSAASLRRLCVSFGDAYNLHHLTIVGHHHKKTHQLGVEGARILCSSLIQADELSSLRLPWNDLGDAGCNVMANAVQVNEYNWRFPFFLDLSFNRIAERGATILCTALRSNKLITRLDLRGNNLHDRGAGALCAALKFNRVLEELNLQSNGIGDSGATMLADAFNLTTSLKRIDLWGNPVRHRGALAIANAIASAHGETPIQLLRIDEAWLPVQKLFGTNPEDQSLNFRGANLGTLDAIIVARLITRNQFLYSLDLSKNNLTGPGKSPINTQKDFSSAIQVVGQDNERYGAWNDGSSDEDENSDNDEEENNDDDEGSEDNVETGDADMMREAKLAKFRKKTPKPPPKDTLEGVDVNHYGIYLILKHLVGNKYLRRLRLGQKDIVNEPCILDWVWAAVDGNEVLVELLVARQTLMIQSLARCMSFGSIKNPEPVFEPVIDLSESKPRRFEETIIERLLEKNMVLETLNQRNIEGLKNVDVSGQKLRHFEFIQLCNRLRDHRFAEIVNLSLTNMTPRSACYLAEALPTVQMLEELDLRYNAIDDDAGVKILQSVAGLRHIHKVDLSWNLLTSVFVAGIRPILPQCKFLTEFYVHGNELGAPGIIDLCSQMLINTTIVDLKMGWSAAKISDAGCIARMLRENAFLKFLNIDGIAIGDDGAANIADALTTNEKLEELHMARDREDRFGTVIGHLGVMALARMLSQNKTLTCLDIAQSQPGLHGFWEIGKHLAKNTTLRKLYLTNDIETDPEFLIGPYGMQAFCDCFDDRYKWALNELDISGHLIGDSGCTHLANLLYRNASMQRNLVFLAVKNQGLTYDGCKKLLREYHKAGITKFINLEKNNGLTMQQRDQLREVTSNFGRVNVLIEPKPLVTFKTQTIEQKAEVTFVKKAEDVVLEMYKARAERTGFSMSKEINAVFKGAHLSLTN